MPRHRNRKPEPIVWGLPAIGRTVGRGRDFAEAMTMLKGNPIRRVDGRYYAMRDELLEFMRSLGKATT